MKSLRVALVPLARVNFDMELATEVTRAFRKRLIFNGLRVAGRPEPVTNQEEALARGRELLDEQFDLLLLFQATFADSTMATALAEVTDRPLFLWAVPDEPTGERLRLNSLCGVNLAAHALTLRNHDYFYAYAAPGDREALNYLKAVTEAAAVRRQLQSARLGVVGRHPAGMDTCVLDEPELVSRLGVEIVHVDLGDLFARIRAVPAKETAGVQERLGRRLEGLATLYQSQLQTSLASYQVLKEVARAEKLDGLAVRCWPEFFTDLHCSACGPLSMLTSERIPCSCEADINGTITQLILQWLGEQPAFGADMVSADVGDDTMVLWHCGLAPLNMADPNFTPRATVHSNRHLPLLLEFPLKPGRVTFARLSRASGSLSLVVGGGEMLSRPPSFSGTSGVVRFDRPVREVLDRLLSQGLEHHISLTYGDHNQALQALARMLGLPLLPLTGEDGARRGWIQRS